MEEKRIFLRYLVIIFIFAFLVFGLVYLKKGNLTGFAVFNQGNQSEFDLGTYQNTKYNGSAVILSGANLTGNYTSKIFDAGNVAIWNNLTWQGNVPTGYNSFLISAMHLGVNRTEVFSLNGDYYLADMKDSSKNFYLNFSKNLSDNTILKLYAKTNKGVAIGIYAQSDSDGNNPFGVFSIDSITGSWYNITLNIQNPTKTIWVGEGSESGTDPKDYFDYIYAEVPGTNLTFQVRNCSSSDCSDGTWQTLNLNSINLQSRYFQYKVNFSTPDSSITPSLDSVTVDYTLVNTAPSLNLIKPQNGDIYNYNSLISLNFTVSDSDGNLQACWYKIDSGDNIILPGCQNTTINSLDLGSHTLTLYANDSLGALSSISISFSITNTAPSLSLTSPQQGANYGYNISLPLQFSVSDIDNNLDSCWYNINSGTNIILRGCQNTTIDVPEGSNTLIIYVNDTQGEEASDSVTFSVDIGAPTIILNSPINQYLSSHDVTFRYTPSDIDLQACELWGNFPGIFSLNQTNNNPTNNTENTFSLTLIDGTYLWNIRCNDSQGHEATNGNQTFFVDTIKPTIILTQPAGAKNSRTEIPLTFSVTDVNLNNCWYNIEWSTGGIVISNTTILNCLSTNFNVSADGNYILNFYANDSATNFNSASSLFSVSTSPPAGGGGGGGGGGTTIIIPQTNITPILKLEISSVGDVIIKPGESKILSAAIKNIGTRFLNKCKISGSGEVASMISSKDIKNLAAGQKEDFVFNINIPENAEAKDYNAIISVSCEELQESSSFKISVIKNLVELKIKGISDIKTDSITFTYIIKELTNKQQNAEITYWLIDAQGSIIASNMEIVSLTANQEQEIQRKLNLPSNTIGEYVLKVKASGKIPVIVEESLIIAKRGLAGFVTAVFGGNNSIIAIVILVLGIIAFFVVRKIIINIRAKKPEKEREGIIKIKTR